jgi:hypothetical protein
VATKAVPIRQLGPGCIVKTADGIRTIHHIEPLILQRPGYSRLRVYFHGEIDPKTYEDTDCLHLVIPTGIHEHSLISNGVSAFQRTFKGRSRL